MKKLVIGILAHVDAGKTTLSEALLYAAGKIKTFGRVDWRNTYLDTHSLERERGITIFSKQALFSYGNMEITLLDTPGHVDFSAEAERTLAVLDYAILVISGSEGVQAHTQTLWQLLERYRVPTFLFITKMDLAGSDAAGVMADLSSNLDSGCVNFSDPADLEERISICDEALFERYMTGESITDTDIGVLTADRKVFPCYFGSGLKSEGITELLDGLERYTLYGEYPEAFGAQVYKIGHDPGGVRLTYMKVTGGILSVRQLLKYRSDNEDIEEKITGIRLYSGAKFETRDTVTAGDVCAVTGLSRTYVGQGLGDEDSALPPFLEPVLHYRLGLPKETDPRLFLPKLKELEEEEPLLHIVWNERYGEIHAQVMGDIQTEVLTRLVDERYGVPVTFEDGRIVYRETISGTVEGVGHFEPLRHYAEVHLVLEPLEAGSGLVFDTTADEDHLDRNWQRLVLTHLEEKTHLGVLTGTPITDMKITLTAGRAHLKHTEGGDFRQATYRAVRQGLMQAREAGKCVLLEPWYAFRLEVPGECVGRAISDILARNGTYDEHEATPGTSVLQGRAPVSTMGDYAREVAAYTHGLGKLSCRADGYYPCHNTAEVMAEYGYNPEADTDNSPDSVFCSHGAGVIVPWREVQDYMHLEATLKPDKTEAAPPKVIRQNLNLDEKELEAIMEREFGPIRRKVYGEGKRIVTAEPKLHRSRKSLYIIDGYNVIFAWEELATIAETDLEGARIQLCDILANYRAFTKREMILVFDAYNVKGTVARKLDYQGLNVVYTKENELGDTYIEKLVNEIGRDHSVRVVTSDGLIQLQAVRSGVLRLSAREFREEILAVDKEIAEILAKLQGK
ncbi:MAG: TetM/TetW/TetO/TetS family tetracycline resistance ribosomal protection protein [Clostridia bacterium]|nr:TetM/TetW/TetO/TetS family tetracycline resistance ribosomal protection protein [Clostridia bacterium]